jgi:hypothetical protein
MDTLERDYKPLLLADHEAPCLSLYQTTHRAHPNNKQDPIRFRNLVRVLELSLQQKYAGRESASLLSAFREFAGDEEFWNHTLEGLAVFAAPGLFKVYRLPRPVPELTIVADSFHTKPLMRLLQSADRYQVLGLNRHEARFFEGNRYVLDEIELGPEFPRTVGDVVGVREGEPERNIRVYGAGTDGTTMHGTDVRQQSIDADTERFFRAVDRSVLENYSQPSVMPLLLAALPEHHHMFRAVSRNSFLIAEAIDMYPGAMSMDDLRERAWQLILPHYLLRLSNLVERFGTASANNLGSDDLAEVARATAAHRISTLLIEADRQIPGRFDPVSGAIEFGSSDNSLVDDLLDDLGEHALKSGSEVVIVPTDRMPTNAGIAGIFRF